MKILIALFFAFSVSALSADESRSIAQLVKASTFIVETLESFTPANIGKCKAVVAAIDNSNPGSGFVITLEDARGKKHLKNQNVMYKKSGLNTPGPVNLFNETRRRTLARVYWDIDKSSRVTERHVIDFSVDAEFEGQIPVKMKYVMLKYKDGQPVGGDRGAVCMGFLR